MSQLALSLKQPWAALLATGRKTVEVRRWTTAHRGEVLIHAARVDDDRPEAWAHVDEPLRPLARLRGGVIGVGVLAEVREYRGRDPFAADQGLHLNEPDWFEERGLYGFRFEWLRVIPYRRVPGFFKLFAVDLEVEGAPAALAGQSSPPVSSVKGQGGKPDLPEGTPLGAVTRRFRRLARTLARRPPEET